jgi:hypothetical protein
MMRVEFYNVSNLPIAVIDEYYDSDACDRIWQELCFLNNDQGKLQSPTDTGSALDLKTGVPLKRNQGIDLDSVYADRSISNILRDNKKLFRDELTDQLMQHHAFFRYLRGDPENSTLVQYYENGDHYKKHTDGAVITAITFFYKHPKSFSGGNLIFEDKLQVDCGYNRMVIFPSILFHAVESVNIDCSLVGQNFGRYSITQFVGNPIGDQLIQQR